MARQRGRSMVRYRWVRPWGPDLDYGPKIISDYGDVTYRDRLVVDDFGNTFDTRKHAPDQDYDFPTPNRP